MSSPPPWTIIKSKFSKKTSSSINVLGGGGNALSAESKNKDLDFLFFLRGFLTVYSDHYYPFLQSIINYITQFVQICIQKKMSTKHLRESNFSSHHVIDKTKTSKQIPHKHYGHLAVWNMFA